MREQERLKKENHELPPSLVLGFSYHKVKTNFIKLAMPARFLRSYRHPHNRCHTFFKFLYQSKV